VPDEKRVALFVTCLVDLIRPSVGFAAVKLLQDAGFDIEVPVQTCCGQPAYNSGDEENARAIARQVIAAFEPYHYVVAPSGSCAGMIKEHYPRLFRDDPDWGPRANALAAKSHELLSFLVDVAKVEKIDASFAQRVTYHDSCSGLRELGVKQQPRRLLNTVNGLVMQEMPDSEVCCGFGGTFCVKYPKLSERMVSDKAHNIKQTSADVVLGGDLGCLLNIAGRLKRIESPVKVYHVAEVLAGMTDEPAIGEPES